MINETCIGEYEMHQECRFCKIQMDCKRKYNKLLTIIRKQIEVNLPRRAKVETYQELQLLEAQRQRVRDKLKVMNKLRKEAREAQYNYTLEMNRLLGIKVEE